MSEANTERRTEAREASAAREADGPRERADHGARCADVLIVGDGDRLSGAIDEAQRQAHFGGRTHRSKGFMHALGELATQGQPRLIIGQAEKVSGSLPAMLQSIHELAPGTPVVLLERGASTADGDGVGEKQAPSNGVVRLREPVSPRDLAAVLRDRLPDLCTPTQGEGPLPPSLRFGTKRGTSEPGAASPASDPVEQVAHDIDLGEAHPTPFEVEQHVEVDAAADENVIEIDEAEPMRADHADVHASKELGDIDLIEQILSDPRQLPSMALRVITSRSALDHVGFTAEGEEPPTDHRAAPIAFMGKRFGWLHAPAPARRAELLPWAGWMARWMALEGRMAALGRLALRDELTGIWNRRYFDRFLNDILKRAHDDRFSVTLLMFDIDDFKQFNDEHGHAAGDDILMETARLMKSSMREHDVVARIGGDEFAVIFWDKERPRQPNSRHPHDVVAATERFRKAIAAQKFPKLGRDAPGMLTISCGLATYPWDGMAPADLMAVADKMLFQSKSQGKNVLTLGPGLERRCNGDGEAEAD